MGGTGEWWMGVGAGDVWKNNSETGNKRSNVVFSGRKSIKVGACRSPLCTWVFLDILLSCFGFCFLIFSFLAGWEEGEEGGQSIKVGADHHFALEPLTLFHFFHKKTISQGQHISSQIISFIICFKRNQNSTVYKTVQMFVYCINITPTRQIRVIDLDAQKRIISGDDFPLRALFFQLPLRPYKMQ